MPKTNASLNFKIAMTGVFAALSVVLALTPIGYIVIPGTFISITIMHVPAILAALTAGLGPGISVGFVFGLTSLIRAAVNGGGSNPFFLNPLVSVLPRMIFPIAAWVIFKIFNSIPKMPKAVSAAFASAAGTFVNTALVMLAIYLFYGQTLISGMTETFEKFGFNILDLSGFKGYYAIMACTLLTNGFFEIIAAMIICIAVVTSIYAIKNKKSKITRLEEESEKE